MTSLVGVAVSWIFIYLCLPSIQSQTVRELIASRAYQPAQPAPNQNFIIVNGNFRSGCGFWNKLFKVTANTMGAYYRRNKEFDDIQDNPKATVQQIEVTLIREKADALIIFERINWFNFTDFDRPQPTWVNTVRHPMDSFTSRWYFCRYGSSKQVQPNRKICPNAQQASMFTSLDEC